MQNFLWRNFQGEDLNSIELLIVTYETSAPFLTTQYRTLVIKTDKETFLLASCAVLTQCYIDDILYCNSES